MQTLEETAKTLTEPKLLEPFLKKYEWLYAEMKTDPNILMFLLGSVCIADDLAWKLLRTLWLGIAIGIEMEKQ